MSLKFFIAQYPVWELRAYNRAKALRRRMWRLAGYCLTVAILAEILYWLLERAAWR